MINKPSNEPIFLEHNSDDASMAKWSIGDTWLGVVIFLLLIFLFFIVIEIIPSATASPLLMIGTELATAFPVLIIFLWRGTPWKDLGFRAFDWSVVGIGCGLLVIVYFVILIHNTIMTMLGVITQGDVIYELFDNLDSPIAFFFVGIIMAPIMEEIFFRGFLFKGFRQKYGWKWALIISSLIFGLSHIQPAALFPTFLLGCLLAYMYHRSNSLFPGMIFHFMINAFGICAAFLVYKFHLM